MVRIKRILHPSDFSRASGGAFAKAVQLAKDNRAELVVMHALALPSPLVPGEGYIAPAVYDEMERSSRAWATRQLDKLVRKAKKAGARARAVLVEGTPYDRIIRAARAHRSDLIVIGTHGRTGLARLFLGSVAARVLSTAHCPVLTVRGR
jgi:nucleotide-binding universal stress UspA family protein